MVRFTRGSECRDRRLHHQLLQPIAPPLDDRLPQPRRVRAARSSQPDGCIADITRTSTKPGQVQPIGDHATLQPLLVQRHLPPSAYWWPINREGLLPLQGGGALHRVSRKLLRRLFDRYWQLREPARREPESFESVRAAAFNAELK